MPNPFTVVAGYSAASLGLNDPAELAIGPNGEVYVTDGSQRVTAISPSGKVILRWGGPGRGKGQFSFGHSSNSGPLSDSASIAVGPDGEVYVSDSGNARVEVFSPTGRFIRQFGRFGFRDGQFQRPAELAADPEGNVYVADSRSLTITKSSPAGRFEWTIGGPTAPDPTLQAQPHFANLDAHGRLVAANESGWILYIDPAGHKVDSFALPAGLGPCSVTVDNTGDTFVQSCPVSSSGDPPLFRYQGPFVFDHAHHLVGEWINGPLAVAPQFGPNGEVFALGDDGSILRLKVALPGA